MSAKFCKNKGASPSVDGDVLRIRALNRFLDLHLIRCVIVYASECERLIERSTIMKEEVQAALDLVRPQLQADGGDAEIVDVSEDGVVKLRLKGACGGCPMSQMTLKMGIERILKEKVPSVKSVEAVL
jgi:Fe-S cluster biogenesis protein NfuA